MSSRAPIHPVQQGAPASSSPSRPFAPGPVLAVALAHGLLGYALIRDRAAPLAESSTPTLTVRMIPPNASQARAALESPAPVRTKAPEPEIPQPPPPPPPQPTPEAPSQVAAPRPPPVPVPTLAPDAPLPPPPAPALPSPEPVADSSAPTATVDPAPAPEPAVPDPSETALPVPFSGPEEPVVATMPAPATGGSPPVSAPEATPPSAADLPPGPEPEYGIGYYLPPQPVYPPLARARGEQGTVLLTVDVSPAGEPTRVVVSASSGFPALDAAAVEEVKQVRFVPRRRGQTPIAGTVDVPIRYALTNPNAP